MFTIEFLEVPERANYSIATVCDLMVLCVWGFVEAERLAFCYQFSEITLLTYFFVLFLFFFQMKFIYSS